MSSSKGLAGLEGRHLICTNFLSCSPFKYLYWWLCILTLEFWPSKQEGLSLKKQQICPSASSAFVSPNLSYSPCRHNTISPVKQDQLSKQDTEFWHRTRDVVSFSNVILPLSFLGSNMLIYRLCSSTLYHQVALFSLPWDGSVMLCPAGRENGVFRSSFSYTHISSK